MDTKQFALNSCLCNLEKMLEEENTSLINFGLPQPDMSKEQYIQNCLMDQYVANEDGFTPKKAKAFLMPIIKKSIKTRKKFLNFSLT